MAMNMQEWNELYPPGTPVLYTPKDGEPVETVTRSTAWYQGDEVGAGLVVRLVGYANPVWLRRVWLRRVKPVVEGPARMTIEDLETYLLDMGDMEKGQDPVALAIATIEKLSPAPDL